VNDLSAQSIDAAQKRLSEALAPYSRREQIAAIDANVALLDLQRWIKRSDLALERNDCSRLHKLVSAASGQRILGLDMSDRSAYVAEVLTQMKTPPFVVKHDWASAFANAEGIAEGFLAPYDWCAFEFRISGKNVIALITSEPTYNALFAFVESGELWFDTVLTDGEDSGDALTRLLNEQIRAICIALDADVATHSVVRAPIALNEKRIRAGKVPLRDYHVVDLARRHRIANPVHGDGGTKKRLHFRRGHWRHFESSKTWIKWCLVGDPDLGFISKHYSL
jgi:hypothetical protein